MRQCFQLEQCIPPTWRLHPLQGRTVNDFMRHLKAAYVEGLDAQQEGEIDPLAFNWKQLSQ